MRTRTLISALVGLSVGISLPALAQPKVEETPLGPYDARATAPTFSKDGMHIAIPTAKGSRQVIIVDGVEGPRIDRLVNTIVFSDSGQRHAYTAVSGTDAIVVLDGKEVARTPLDQGMMLLDDPKFSPGGKWFSYQRREQKGAVNQLVINGQPGERYQAVQSPIYSADDTRYAYLATKIGDNSGRMNLVVDGKDVGFQGAEPQFSPDGKTIVTVGHTPTEDVLLLNGKAGSRAKSIRGVYMSKGGINLLVLGKDAGNAAVGEYLGASGKKIDGSDCEKIEWVKFSPDGKRYAALCSAGTMIKYLLIDGKKSENYEGITDFSFSPDSTRTMFKGRSATGTFVVVDDVESKSYPSYSNVAFAAGGKRVGYLGTLAGSRDVDVVLDGKITKFRGAQGLEFSADGSRYGFVGGDPVLATLFLDGVEQKVGVIAPNNFGSDPHWFVFSPDGKRVAHQGFIGSRQMEGLMVDGKILGKLGGLYHSPMFTPDSQHVFCFTTNPGNGRAFALILDGQPAVIFDALAFSSQGRSEFLFPAAMEPDGVFTFIGANEEMWKRYRVTPAAGTSIATAIAALDAAEAKLVADAEAAKKAAADAKAKADADRVAAAAKAKADAEALAVKKKADLDAANAARLKAQKDAAAARAAAQKK